MGQKEEEKPWYTLFFTGWWEKDKQIEELVLDFDWKTGEYTQASPAAKVKPAQKAAASPRISAPTSKGSQRYTTAPRKNRSGFEELIHKAKMIWTRIQSS